MRPSAAAAVFAALLWTVGCPLAGFATESRMDARESVVDRALGGMEEGSRMPHPEGSFTQNGRRVPGSQRSPSGEQRGTAAPSATSGSSSAAPTAPGSPSISGGSVGPGPGGSAESTAPKSSGESVGSVGAGGEPSGGLSGGGGAGENKDVGGGGVGGGAGVEAGAGAGGGADLGSGTETGQGESGGGVAEPVGGGSSGGSIIDVDAGVSVDNGNVETNVDVVVDTEADKLLELDAATDVAAEGPVAVEAESTESAVIETELGIEEGINDAPASGEGEAGLDADVDAAGESDEPLNNPADGLSL